MGVLKTKTQISNYNTPDNECIFIPYDTMALLARHQSTRTISSGRPINPMFRVGGRAAGARDAGTAAQLLADRTNAPSELVVFNEFLRMVSTMGLALRLLLGFVGALTLAIGGVGLANIMLVSVTQRTREIGVLKSLGATRRAILFQFLAEALAIVTLGGILGVLTGYCATATLRTLPLLGPIFKNKGGDGRYPLANIPFRGPDVYYDVAGGGTYRRSAARR